MSHETYTTEFWVQHTVLGQKKTVK
jgi:hypothetical protein